VEQLKPGFTLQVEEQIQSVLALSYTDLSRGFRSHRNVVSL